MSKTVIDVRNLGKYYSLGATLSPDTLRDYIMHTARRLFNRNESGNKSDERGFWALKDVSFQVQKGEVLGVIGPNGAGKSTLLKILTGITEPTEGEVRIKGRVASLLEVGTGFHPELSGRENIFMNGAILGMTQREIKTKFDEIVDFAGVENFLDTPVKRYSSGMRVRLGFAVAAHLEPEILLVDEVLAVGDAEFQKKCIGKMEESSGSGRTVLFVSHNMAAILSLCPHSLLLEQGKILLQGETTKIIEHYFQKIKKNIGNKLSERLERTGEGQTRFTDIWIENDKGEKIESAVCGQDITLVAEYKSQKKDMLKNPHVAFAIQSNTGERITNLWNESAGYSWHKIPPEGTFRCFIPNLSLNVGSYIIHAFIQDNGIVQDHVRDSFVLEVIEGDFYKSGKLPKSKHGYFLLNQTWKYK